MFSGIWVYSRLRSSAELMPNAPLASGVTGEPQIQPFDLNPFVDQYSSVAQQ